jgi:hypothetical protein
MLHWLRYFVLLALALPVHAQGTSEWAYDVLRLKNGVVLKGMFVEEGPRGIRFRLVKRVPGRPTISLMCEFDRSEVAALDKRTEEERAELKAKLADIDLRPDDESKRLEALDLKKVDWLGKKEGGLQYDSDYFSLKSDAPEEIVRRAAYRLETVYAAYTRFLPPRIKAGTPAVIHVYQSIDGYRKALPAGSQFRNPAYYDPSSNRVVCGTELRKIGEDLDRFRHQSSHAFAEWKKQEEEIRRLYGKKPAELDRHLQPIRTSRSRLKQIAEANEAAFDRATQILFRILYHEVFHAYVGTFVYPSHHNREGCPGELPRWLNEGMAQVFETAIFEAGELRIGHADKEFLSRAQESLRRKELLPLSDLLRSSSKDFIVMHGTDRTETDRAYITTWALASYLMFDRRVLGTEALDNFVRSMNAGTNPVESFEKLVGQEVGEFEKAFHTWLGRLRPDGTAPDSVSRP